MLRKLSPVLVSSSALLGAAPAAPQQPLEFAAQADLVQIDVVVIDAQGRPVTGLEAKDFEVSEDGRAQPIASFEPVVVRGGARLREAPPAVGVPRPHDPGAGRYLVLFFDDQHLSPPSAQQARRAVAPFLASGLRDGDVVTVVAPVSGVWWTARTAWEHRRLPEVVARVEGRLARSPFGYDKSEWQAMREVEYGSPMGGQAVALSRGGEATAGPGAPVVSARSDTAPRAQEIYATATARIRQTLGALEDLLGRLEAVRGRKTVIFLSEGFVRAPRLALFERVVERARRANTAVELLDPRGLRSGLIEGEDPSSGPRQESSPLVALQTAAAGALFVAHATGGRALLTNDVAAAVREVVDESAAYYLLGYPLPDGEPGERRVRVRVRRDGLTVRARERYFVGAVEAHRETSPAGRALRAATDEAGLSIRVAALCSQSTADGEISTSLAVEIDPVPGEAGPRRLRLLAEAQPIAGGEPLRDSADLELEAGEQRRVATREWALAPGVWQARVVVEEPAAERVGSVLHTFEVPEPGAFRLGSVVLADRRPDGSAAPRLLRRYGRADTLLVRYDVFGAAADPASGRPRVVGAAAVVRGAQLVESFVTAPIEPRPDGSLTRTLMLPLAGLAPGRYDLRIEVRDELTGERRERLEPFEVLG